VPLPQSGKTVHNILIWPLQVKDLTQYLDPSGLGAISFEDFHQGIMAIRNGGQSSSLCAHCPSPPSAGPAATCPPLALLLLFFLFFNFCGTGLNSGSHICQAGALPLEPLLQHFLMLDIFEIGSHKLFAQAGSEP
jgi:hypothetical protein